MTSNAGTMAIIALFLICGPANSQVPLLKRGPAHEQLDFLVGEWHAETKRLQPAKMTMTTKVTFAWKYGDVYLEEYDPTEIENSETIHNVMLMTWNPNLKSYTGAWFDNVSPTMVHFQAKWKDDDTLVLDSGDIMFGGRPHRAVVTYIRETASRIRKEFFWSWDNSELQPVAFTTLEKIG